MVAPMRRVHWLRAVAVLATVMSGLLLGGGVPALAGGGTTIGPVQINPVGHPHLCWQATGNGAPIVLETCDSALQNQQWSLTPDGVIMNGIGYCLEALPGQPAGVPLYIDFADQCGGSHGQVWQYNGTNGHLSSQGTCAVLGGAVSPGTEIVRRSCSRGPRWSIGYSAVTLRPGTGSGPVGGMFDASVTVANAASAQTAYGVTVTFGPLGGLNAAGLRPPSGWRCDLWALTCTGTLLAGASGQIDVSGRLPAAARSGRSDTLTARARVGGTSQLPGQADQAVTVSVSVHPAAPVAGGADSSTAVYFLALIVALLLVGGGLLTGLTLRRRPVQSADYEGRRRRLGARLPGRLDAAVAHPAGQSHAKNDRDAGLGIRVKVDVRVAHRQVVSVHDDARSGHQHQGPASHVHFDEERVNRDDRLGEVERHIAP
jgi:hypothetical protein